MKKIIAFAVAVLFTSAAMAQSSYGYRDQSDNYNGGGKRSCNATSANGANSQWGDQPGREGMITVTMTREEYRDYRAYMRDGRRGDRMRRGSMRPGFRDGNEGMKEDRDYYQNGAMNRDRRDGQNAVNDDSDYGYDSARGRNDNDESGAY